MTAGIGELTPADRNCVFLIDGLGWEQLQRPPGGGAVPERPCWTASRGGTGRPITAGYPATTATSLASVGTGLPPGAHGLPGYTVRDPDTGELMNQLRWQPLDRAGRLAAVPDRVRTGARARACTPPRCPPRPSPTPR
ncbi:Alkaline phosphatase family protein OS=Streptomyces tendae OX=1932 GN=F3L20_08215 PE=4 SV=1 [Streptomyces tendae]